MALAVFGWINGPSYLLMGLGAFVAFLAIYDRCPIYRAVSQKVREFLKRKPLEGVGQ